MLALLVIVIGPALTLAVCVFALVRGGEAERQIAVAALFALCGSIIAQDFFGRSEAWPVIVADTGLAVVIATVAAIHLRVWLIVEGGLATGLLLLHGVMFESHRAHVTPLYAAAVNSLNIALLITLAVATMQCQSRRRN